jgi:putative hemolysin
MLDLERQVAERFPRWFAGRRAPFARRVARAVGRFSRLDDVRAFLQASRHLTGHAFVEAALEFLQVRYSVDHVERERIPQSGPALIVANHPCGARDALALLHFVATVRRDVRIVANDMLCALDGLRDLLLPLRILGGRPGAAGIAAVEGALAAGQCVIVFPAGEVSRLGWKGITDSRWRRGVLRFARTSGAPLVPVKVNSRNSGLFYGASAVYKPLGTLLLLREAVARKPSRIELRVGLPRLVRPSAAPDVELESIRQALYAIGTRKDATPPGAEPVIHAVDRRALLAELRDLPCLGRTPDGKRIHAGRLGADSVLLREIGRLRELSFRAVGEGTGRRLDVDAYDTWYDHIVLWDADQLEIAGAYRAAHGRRVMQEHGLPGFYAASLFDLGSDTAARLAEGVELGRSFVAPAYWGTRSLDYLWLGIGAYLGTRTDVRYLLGSVSISAALPVAAREQLVAYYARYYGGGAATTVARRPFRFLAAAPCFGPLDAEQAYRVLRANLDALGASVPVLYKQYTELCEPGGARFLAFGVDAAFNNAIDGLIEVDLHRVRPKKRQRYLAAMATDPATREDAPGVREERNTADGAL